MNQRDKVAHELISAYLDGELSVDERARAEQLLCSDPEHQQVLEDMQTLSKDMGDLPAYRLDEQFADRVIAVAGQADPVRVKSRDPLPVVAVAASRHWRAATLAIMAAAAVLLLALFLRDDLLTGPTGGDRLVQSSPRDVESSDRVTESDDTVELKAGPNQAQAAVSPEEAKSVDVAAAGPGGAAGGTGAVSVPEAGDNAAVSANDTPGPESGDSVGQVRNSGGPMEQATEADVPAAKPRIEMGPGRISQKILLVIDVQLTKQASDAGQFERLLREEGVAFDTSIKVEAGLEQSLLDSRFFEPLDDKQDSRPPFTVVYVVSRGGAIDRTWTRMQQDPANFSRVALDMALHPNDITIFGRLHQLGDVTALQTRNPEQSGVALPLELSPTWNGVPVKRTAEGGPFGQLMSSETPPGRTADPTPEEEADLPFSGHMTEAIFVLHGTSD